MRMRPFVAVAAAAASVLSGVALGSGAAQADPACPSLYTVAIPGTWEAGAKGKNVGHGMLSQVTRGLPGKVDYVEYPATAFPWEGDVYGRSKKAATDAARGLVQAMAQRCGNTKIAITGYSQGADAAGDLAAEIGTGVSPIRPERIVAVGLISDPRRSPTDPLVGPPLNSAGAGGARVGGFGHVTGNLRTICAPGDLYCNTAQDDFVTRFAGFLAQTSDPSAAHMWRYQQEAGTIFNDLFARGGLGLLATQLSESSNKDRVKKLERFYGSHAHTNYGSFHVAPGQSALSWMHNWIAGRA